MQLYSSVKDNATQRNDGHQKEAIREAKSKQQSLSGFAKFLFHLHNEELFLWDTAYVLLRCQALVDVVPTFLLRNHKI